MDTRHCKDIIEDLFEKEDYSYHFEELVEPCSGYEALVYFKMMKMNPVRKLRKSLNNDL